MLCRKGPEESGHWHKRGITLAAENTLSPLALVTLVTPDPNPRFQLLGEGTLGGQHLGCFVSLPIHMKVTSEP